MQKLSIHFFRSDSAKSAHKETKTLIYIVKRERERVKREIERERKKVTVNIYHRNDSNLELTDRFISVKSVSKRNRSRQGVIPAVR